MTEQKRNIFERGILRIHAKVRPTLWRKLYHVTYKMSANQQMPESDALKELKKFARLYRPHGVKFRNMGKLILYNMMDAVIENQDDFFIWNYYARATEKERYGFAHRTLKKMHRKISDQMPHLRPYLTTIKTDKEYNKKPNKSGVHGYYSASTKTIGITPLAVRGNDVYELINTMAHEYVHLLQAAYSSSLPYPVLHFIDTHVQANQDMEYRQRPIEQEAFRAGALIAKSFRHRFDDYWYEYNNKKSTGYGE